MSVLARGLVILCLAFVPLLRAGSAAATPYQGIYVLIDPYRQPDINDLKTAAKTECVEHTVSTASPFCGSASGVVLKVNWCNFQLYHAVNSKGVAYPSCHYTVNYTDKSGRAPVETPATDAISPCPGTFDTCAGTPASVLGTALGLIGTIDARRAAAGLAPLQLSIGLGAGASTPQQVLNSAGTVDVATNSSQDNNLGAEECVRLPLPWAASFTAAYDTALDTLISYVQTQLGSDASITMVKPSAITATSLEILVPGSTAKFTTPADPGPGGPGPLLSCSQTVSGARVWLTTYNNDPVGSETFSTAMENSFGAVIGHAWGSLANAGLTQTILSIPTNNATAMADIDCGVTGYSKCGVNPNQGNYTIYYFEKYVDDLFNGGLSHVAAAAAYRAIRNDTFSLAPAQLAVNSTALSTSPLNQTPQVECALNNTLPAHAPVDTLDGNPVQVIGSGTALGWQTLFNEGGACSSGAYGAMLDDAIGFGALYLEVETDAAFQDLPSCSGQLSAALGLITAAVPPTVCQY